MAHQSAPNATSPVPFTKLPHRTRILADLAYSQGQRNHAIRLWEAAIRMGVEDSGIYLSLGKARYESGDPERTEQVWREGLAKHDNQAFLAYNLALLFNIQGRNGESEAMFLRAISSSPVSAFFYRDYGQLLEKQDRISDARRIYAQGLRRSPNDPDLKSALSALPDSTIRSAC